MYPQNEKDLVSVLQAERDITRLINSYPYLLDSGKFSEVAGLLRHATLEVPVIRLRAGMRLRDFCRRAFSCTRTARLAPGTPSPIFWLRETPSAVKLQRPVILPFIRNCPASPCNRFALVITKTALHSSAMNGSSYTVPLCLI